MFMSQSIVRRSLAVTAFYVLGHGFNYLLLVASNRLLRPEIFGLFYISNSMINVLMTPGPVLAMSFGQHFARLAASGGIDAVSAALGRTLVAMAGWGSFATMAVLIALAVAGQQFGVDSFAVLVLIPVIACVAVLFEIVRACFQALHRFAWFSASWVLWCGLHFILSLAGLYLVGTVWAGLLGSLLATIALMTVVLVILPVRSARPSPRAETAALPIKLRSVLVPVIAYGCFNLLASADVLLAYVLLNRNQLGVYIASSLLPKAIVTITLPVAQVLLPVLAAPASSSQTLRTAVLKALSVVLMLAGCASAVLWMGAAMVCNEQFGIRFCDIGLMSLLALAAIPLSITRVLVVNSLAIGSNWRPLLQVLGLAAIGILAGIYVQGDAYRLGTIYLAVCSGVMVLYVFADMVSERSRGQHPTISSLPGSNESMIEVGAPIK